mgnify:CR=1 FL=1
MAKKQEKTIKVTLVKSATGFNKRQTKILEALGFRKLGQTRVLPDNDCIRGSIFKVKHLLKVEEDA